MSSIANKDVSFNFITTEEEHKIKLSPFCKSFYELVWKAELEFGNMLRFRCPDLFSNDIKYYESVAMYWPS